MSGVWLFDLIDEAGVKLYTFKLVQNNGNAPAVSDPPNSLYEDPTAQYIYDSGAFNMEITYAYNANIPTVTSLGVYYTPDGSLTDPAAGKFYVRFTTDDNSIYESQAGKFISYVPSNGTGSQSGNYDALADPSVSSIVYTLGPAQSPSGNVFLNSLPLAYNIGSTGTKYLNNTVWTSSTVIPVSIPEVATVSLKRDAKGETYYINRLLKMGYTMSQIVPPSLYTSYTSVYMTFPSYDLRQLFIDGNLALNGCRCDKGRIY